MYTISLSFLIHACVHTLLHAQTLITIHTVTEQNANNPISPGMLFILISLWNITVTECVAIKSQGTMLIMMVVWNILAGNTIFGHHVILTP